MQLTHGSAGRRIESIADSGHRASSSSVSVCVRSAVTDQASRQLAAAELQTIVMTPEEQLEFWNTLAKPPRLTKAQEGLAAIMRGEE